MTEFNVTKHIEDTLKFAKEYPKASETFLDQFGGSVAKELAKVGIKYKYDERPHTFANFEKGTVAHKLVIEVDFSRVNVQAHQDFENEFCSAVARVVECNINGLLENADS